MSAGQSLDNPVDGIPPALRERARGIVGRQWVAERVRDWLDSGGGNVDPRRFTELIAHQLAGAHDDFALAVAPGIRSQYNIRLDVRENWGTAVGMQVQNLFVTGTTVSDAFSAAVSRPLRLITEAGPAAMSSSSWTASTRP
jgi:hypothetical protein